jgi:dephospho-CoA kinase
MMIDERNSFVLGITGGLACGKSEVGRILGEMDFSVCDADRVAHGLMKKGTLVYQQVVEHFGTLVLLGNGEISRPLLGNIVFQNPSEREVLNGLVHPAVRKSIENWILEMRLQNKCAAVLVPLLYESGMEALDWDAIICIASSKDLVLQRLENRGLDRNEAELRIASQMQLAEKEQRSDYVILNNGILEELKQSTRETVNRIRVER